MVDDGNGEDGVEALVPVGQGQVVADQNLQPGQVELAVNMDNCISIQKLCKMFKTMLVVGLKKK